MPHVQLHEVDTLGELKDVLDECLISGWMYVVGSTASIRSVARRLEVDGDDCSVFYTYRHSLEDAENSMLCEGYELDLGFSDVGGPGYIYAILLEDEEEEHYDSDHSYGGDTHRTYSRRRRRAGEGHAPIHIGNIYLGEGPNRNRQALETLAVGAKVVSSMATVGAAAVGCGCTIM